MPNQTDNSTGAAVLQDLAAANRNGRHQGIYSICSAHEHVLRAAMQQALADGSPLLIEATCNQVNQYGGYTGMLPADFYGQVQKLAQDEGYPKDQLLLGGDHLGPNPWRHLPAEQALAEAEVLVIEYVNAGFRKIHLDASMACADDIAPLSVATIAQRAARLCAAAESAVIRLELKPAFRPRYVIGTEVPVPGGAQHKPGESEELQVTTVADVAETLEAHREAFLAQGLTEALSRVVALVTQPGVEFDDQSVIDYQPEHAQALSKAILAFPGLVFEAHSTDYQTEAALSALVRDHFAILKVGPGVTFAWREALFALSHIEDELYANSEDRSDLRGVVERRMLADPEHWAPYYQGDEEAQRLARRYSYSDRIRYYWQQPDVLAAVDRLMDNVRQRRPADTLLSQYLPQVQAARRAQILDGDDPLDWLRYEVRQVIASYARACGLSSTEVKAA
jgi:D-tagatose-1,6-bisphosphate aldolase subunit GatZ/KbaZ